MIVTYDMSEQCIEKLERVMGLKPLTTRKQALDEWAQAMIDKEGWLVEDIGTERVMDWVVKDVDLNEKPEDIVAVIYEALELLAYSFDTVYELVAGMDPRDVGVVYADDWSGFDEAFKREETHLVATSIEEYRALAFAASVQWPVRDFSISLSTSLDDLQRSLEESVEVAGY